MVVAKTKDFINQFIALESSGGIILIIASILALLFANSALAPLYEHLLHLPMQIKIGTLDLDKTLHHWVNDGLMVVFFFLVGLEIKRELVVGELSSFNKALLPVIGAIGGVVVPALIYTFFNSGNPETMRGWAIPVATDIAFAVGILSLLGSRVPNSLKVFLLSLAIIDDLVAILIIAIFYTKELSFGALGLGFACLLFCITLNRLKVAKITPYVLIGIVMWVCILKSGIHATIAGVALAFTIPLASKDGKTFPVKHLEHTLHPWVAYIIMPIFAFTNAGVSISGLPLDLLFTSVPLGIACGLFFGKQIGVFLFVLISVKIRMCKMPSEFKWSHLYGVSLLCGIGFTMSLFVGNLAFTDALLKTEVTIAVLIGSFFSALVGYFVLKSVCPVKQN